MLCRIGLHGSLPALRISTGFRQGWTAKEEASGDALDSISKASKPTSKDITSLRHSGTSPSATPLLQPIGSPVYHGHGLWEPVSKSKRSIGSQGLWASIKDLRYATILDQFAGHKVRKIFVEILLGICSSYCTLHLPILKVDFLASTFHDVTSSLTYCPEEADLIIWTP